MENYDYISVDFKGHTAFPEDHYEDDISDKIDECIAKQIKSLTRMLKYYILFQECLEKYTQFEITNARLLDENIRKVESDISFGKRHLAGEDAGTYGKECSTKLDSLSKEKVKLVVLWNSIPSDLAKLIQFDLFEL
jgi:hypothetical protein